MEKLRKKTRHAKKSESDKVDNENSAENFLMGIVRSENREPSRSLEPLPCSQMKYLRNEMKSAAHKKTKNLR